MSKVPIGELAWRDFWTVHYATLNERHGFYFDVIARTVLRERAKVIGGPMSGTNKNQRLGWLWVDEFWRSL